MATFQYIAKANPQEKVEGTIDADSINSAAHRLRFKGLFPVHIEPKSFAKSRLSVLERIGLIRVGPGVLAEFTDQFAGLLDAGVPLERALNLLEHQISSSLLRKALEEITESVREGKPLAQALATYPKIFPATYVSMVRVGEEAGLLSDMLRRLAKLLDEEYQLRSKLKAAMVYPIFLSCVGLGTVVVLMVWVIPKFSTFFTSLGHQLPLPTRLVLEVSSMLARTWPFVLIIAVLIVLFGLRLLKIKSVRFMFDRLCLRIPVIGGLIIKTQLAQLMRTLGILLSHGINMLGALSITGDTLNNKFIADQVYKACDGVTRGEKLHECFSEERVFPVTMLGVMAIGQESGDLPQMLLRLSEQYEQQTERRIQALTSMIEPVMILVMGGIVGFVVVSMLMPIFRVSTLVH
jgi:type II secretory pathway component PulF